MLIVSGCGSAARLTRLKTQKQVVPGIINGETRGAAYFDLDGLSCLPYQRNLAPYPSLTQSESFRKGQKPKGWRDPSEKNALVHYFNDGSGEMISATATADDAVATIAVTVPVAPGKNDTTWKDSLALGEFADEIEAAIDVDIDSVSGGAAATLTLSDQDYSQLGKVEKTTIGHDQLKILDAPRLSSESSVSLVFGVKIPKKNGQIDAKFKNAQFTRNYQHTGTGYEQGSKPYLTPPAIEGEPAVVLLPNTEGKTPQGAVERMDGRFDIPVSSAQIDASQAWWQAVEFVPNFSESDQETFDRDLIDWNLDLPDQSRNGVWSLMALFKKPDCPTQDSFGPHLGETHKMHAYIYQYFPSSEGGSNVEEAVSSAEFTFSAGDTIRVVSASLPQGGPGLTPGRYIWTSVNGIPQNGPESYRDLKDYTGNDDDFDKLHDISIGFDRINSGRWEQSEYDAGRPAEFSANGKFRHIYVQQEAVSQATVNQFLKDPGKLGIKYNGLYFPFDAANKLQGRGNTLGST